VPIALPFIHVEFNERMAKRRHHYLPQSYLRNFADRKTNERIWRYPKAGGEPFCAGTVDLGVEKDYHTFTKSDGTKDTDTIENELSKIEGAAVEPVRKIVATEELSAAEHEIFVAFTATMLVRVPERRDSIGKMMSTMAERMMTTLARNKETYHADYRRFQTETGDTSSVDPEKVRQLILSGTLEMKTNPQVALGMSFGALTTALDCLLRLEWTFLHRNGRFKFITCDNPVSYYDPTIPPNSWYGAGLGNPGVEILFPLSPEVAAFGSYHPKRRKHVPAVPEEVRRVNQHTAESAYHYIFADENSEALGRFIAQNSDPTKPLRIK
jgi:hypothetical protein